MATAKPAAKAAPKKKTEARAPMIEIRTKMREASAPESSATAPWEDDPKIAAAVQAAASKVDWKPIDEALNALAAMGIKPDTAPVMSTEMPAVTHTASAPVEKKAETLDDHPLFSNMLKPTFQPSPQVQNATQAPTGAVYAGFSTPLGQPASNFQINKPKDPPKKSTAFFASSSSPL